jgi:phosphoglucosamine mutase
LKEITRPRLFGTDGIRGVAGEYPLDERTIAIIGQSLSLNLSRALGRSPRIVIGRDTRESGPQIEFAFACGALAGGATVRSAGILTTPGIAYITRSECFDAGIVISASHNPFQDNGIKVFAPTGKKIADEMERQIESDIAQAISLGVVIKCNGKEGDWLAHQSQDEQKYAESYVDYLVRDCE